MKSYFIYRNLRNNMFSVRYEGKVVGHSSALLLFNVKFKVSKAGQDRVRREKRKNVHATLQSTYIMNTPYPHEDCREVHYDPYTTDTFVYIDTGEPIYTAKVVVAHNNKIYIVEETT